MLLLGQKAADLPEARRLAEQAIASGAAFQVFRKLVIAQGGDVSYVDDPRKLPKARLVETVKAEAGGFIAGIHAREVGETAVELGAGRAKKTDAIDYAVGIEIHHKVGDRVERGDALFTVHASDQARLEQARARLLAAHQWSQEPVQPLPLFYGVVD